MTGTRASVHPQAFRVPDDQNLRNSFESELWDDNNGMVFYLAETPISTLANSSTNDLTVLTVPAIVACRFQIEATVSLFWSTNQATQGTILVDGTDVGVLGGRLPSRVQGDDAQVNETMPIMAIADVAPGLHSVRIRLVVESGGVTVELSTWRLIVRRGRKPTGI